MAPAQRLATFLWCATFSIAASTGFAQSIPTHDATGAALTTPSTVIDDPTGIVGPFSLPSSGPTIGSVGPSGGVITGDDDDQIRFAPGTFAATTSVSLTSVTSSEVENQTGISFSDWNLTYLRAIRLSTGGASFLKPSTLSLPASGASSSDSILLLQWRPDIDGDGHPGFVLRDVVSAATGRLTSSAQPPFPGITADGTYILLRAGPVAFVTGKIRSESGRPIPASPVTSFQLPIVYGVADESGFFVLAVPAAKARRRPVGHSTEDSALLDGPGTPSIVGRSALGPSFWLSPQPAGLIPGSVRPIGTHVPRLTSDTVADEACSKDTAERLNKLKGLAEDILEFIEDIGFETVPFEPPSVELSCQKNFAVLHAQLGDQMKARDSKVRAFLTDVWKHPEVVIAPFGNVSIKFLDYTSDPILGVAYTVGFPPFLTRQDFFLSPDLQKLTMTIAATRNGGPESVRAYVRLAALKFSVGYAAEAEFVASKQSRCVLKYDQKVEFAAGVDEKRFQVGPAVVRAVGFNTNCPPKAALTAVPPSIILGGSASLGWATTNATSVSITGVPGLLPLSGSVTVSPQATTTYVLTATGPGGETTTSATVIVQRIPTASLTAVPSTIIRGTSSTLTWTTTDADSVAISGLSILPSTNGSAVVSPIVTTTYTLTATGAGGTATTSATVIVSVGALSIDSFTATPTTVPPGGSATLRWTTSNATSVSLSGVATPLPVNGSSRVFPATTTTYTLTAIGPGGSRTATTVVTINQGTTPPPAILSFSAVPAVITAGEVATLSWTTSNAISVQISGLGSQSLNGTASVSPAVSTVYVLTATGAGGDVSTASVTVSLSASTAATYRGSFPATTTYTLGACQWKISALVTAMATISGSGTGPDPYRGSFEATADGTGELLTPTTACFNTPLNLPDHFVGTVSGSAGTVEAHGPMVGFAGGIFSGNTLTGYATINVPGFQPAMVGILTLTRQ